MAMTRFLAKLISRGANNIKEANITYRWSVSEGEIENGQGTPSISVYVPSESTNHNLWATVVIGGFPPGCVSEAKEETSISPTCALPVQADEYGRTSFKDEKARLANIGIQLNANPEFGALFIIYLTKKESKSYVATRVAKIKNYLSKNLGIPETRLRFIYSERDSYLTKIYLMPPSVMDDFLDVRDSPKS